MDKIDFFLCSIETMISNWRPILVFQPPYRAHRFESCKRWNIFLGSPITEKYLSRTVAWKNPVSRVSLSLSLSLSSEPWDITTGFVQIPFKNRMKNERVERKYCHSCTKHSCSTCSCFVKQTYTSPPNDNGCDGILSSVVFQRRS